MNNPDGFKNSVIPSVVLHNRYYRRFKILPALVVLIGLALVKCSSDPGAQYRTVAVERGDIAVEVTASGTVNPRTLVQVGTQVSGTVASIFADFNSHVTKGQLIARIDTTFLYAAVSDARASMRKSQASEALARQNVERTQTLLDKGLAPQVDLDQALADLESAKASLSSSQAQLDRAKINLAYASIRSPIAGVVINRAVDVGQTVAASLNTPTLFTIADDLSSMQVQASIDEADIGQVKIGQSTRFTVDAYPDRSFKGSVTQIRLMPTTVQNVVSYTVVIDVGNPDLVLMPGMTANITIEISQATKVLKVPLAALKFAPPGYTAGKKGRGMINKAQFNSGDTFRSGDFGSSKEQGRKKRGDMTRSELQKPGADSAGSSSGTIDRQKGRVFILENNKPKMVRVTTGLSNNGFIAVEGEIAEGAQVIVGEFTQNKSKTTPQQSPLGGMQPPGGGMMPRRM